MAWILTYEEPTTHSPSILQLESEDESIEMGRGIYPEIYSLRHQENIKYLQDSSLKSTAVWHFVFLRAIESESLI